MNKNESLEIKGIAILMMLFLHLFNTSANVALCEPLLNFWNGKPLVLAMSRIAAFCVPIYIFISGYGLAITYEKKNKMNNINRSFRLYVNYWIVFLLFIPLACLICPEKYPRSFSIFLKNFIGWECSYNYEWWFLFPYLILALCSSFILSFLYRLNKRQSINTLILLFILYLAVNISGKFLKAILAEFHSIQQLFWIISLSFMFVCGAMFARYSLFQKMKNSVRNKKKYNLLLASILIGLLIIRMMLGPSIINPLFVVPFLICFLCMDRPLWLCSFLRYFGHHSTNMWLTHTFFAYYLFQDLIYGFRYPIIIYIVLILVSLGSSYIIQWINKPIQKLMA